MTQILIRAENLREGDIAEIVGTSYKITQVLSGNSMVIWLQAVVPYDTAGSIETCSLHLNPNSMVQVHREL